MNQRRNNRTTTITDAYAKPINDREAEIARAAMVNALIGTHGSDETRAGDDGLLGYWIKYGEYWDCKLSGTLQHGNLSLPFRCTDSIVTVYVMDDPIATQLYYIEDSKTLDLTELKGKRVIIMLSFVKIVKETN